MLGFLNGIGRGASVGQLTLQTLFALPSEFLSRWTPDFNIYEKTDGSFATDFDMTSVKPAGLVAYVAKDGNDTVGDGSEGSPYRTLQKAYDVGGVDIRIKAGLYDRADAFTSANFLPNRNVALTAVDGAGSVILTRSYNSLSWTQQAGANSDVYLTSAASCMFVLDRAAIGRVDELQLNEVDEVPIPLTEVGDIAACQALAGSYFYSGSDLYVHTYDDRAPDDDVLALSNEGFMWFYFGTSQTFYMDGIEIWGRGAVRTEHSNANNNIMAAKDCGFRFSDWVIATVRVQGTRNNYFINCHASDHTTADAFGYAAANVNVTTRALEVNCSARRVGNLGATNDNAFTSHNNAAVIRLNAYGELTYGPIIADVLGSCSMNLGCVAGDSLVPGNSQARVAFQVGTVSNFDLATSKMWMKNCTAMGEYYDRGQANGGEMFDLGGFTGESTGGDYGTIS